MMNSVDWDRLSEEERQALLRNVPRDNRTTIEGWARRNWFNLPLELRDDLKEV